MTLQNPPSPTLRTRVSIVPLTACIFLLAISGARASAGPETLLRLVPEDMAICLLIEDLRGHAAAFLDSPFAKQFMISRLGKELLASPEIAKLRDIDPFLQKNLQISLAQLRDDILGDALVLAYSPGPVDKPDHERGLLLLEARNAERLAKLLDRVIALQKESGEIKEVHERPRGRHKYLAAVGARTTTFYFLSGAILAVTSEEPVLLESIARLDNPAAQSAFKGRFPSLDSAGRVLSLWLNPKPYRSLLEKQAGQVKGPQLAAFNTFLQYWKALDCVGVFVTHRDDCEVTVAVEGRPNDLPPGASNMLLKPPAPASDLAARWPQGAFLTLTRSIDLPGFVAGVSEFMDPSARQSLQASVEQKAAAMLGQDLVGEALPILGPEWGCCLAFPPSGDPAWFPHLLAAVRIHPTPAQPTPDLLLMNALNSVATLVVFAQNQVKPGSISLRSQILDGTEIRYFANDKEFPPGFRPAFACRGGYLVVGSSPAAIGRLALRPSGQVSANSPFLKLLFPPLLAYLRERQEVLATYHGAHDGVNKAEALAGLERLTGVLELFDRLDVSSQSVPNGLAWSMRLKLVAPLR
jgi:hypothetical protein